MTIAYKLLKTGGKLPKNKDLRVVVHENMTVGMDRMGKGYDANHSRPHGFARCTESRNCLPADGRQPRASARTRLLLARRQG